MRESRIIFDTGLLTDCCVLLKITDMGLPPMFSSRAERPRILPVMLSVLCLISAGLWNISYER